VPHGQGGNVYGRKKDFDREQIERRRGLVREYLLGLQEEVRVQVLQQCRKNFDDMQMGELIREFQAEILDDEFDQLDFEFDLRQLQEDQLDFDLDEEVALQLQFGDL
jgi:hypothetical protein